MARIFQLLLVSSAWIASVHCQTSRGIVTGTVLDPLGAAIKGASVALTSQQTGIRLTTSSNQAGVYRFDAVDLAVYDLQVVHPGFRIHVEAGIRAEANRVTTVDPRLEVGPAETRIEVTGQ